MLHGIDDVGLTDIVDQGEVVPRPELLACAGALLAQAPIPKILKEAETAYLVNEGVTGETLRVSLSENQRLHGEAKGWSA
jgi:hypothetical protein